MKKELALQEIRSLMEVIKEQQEMVLSHESKIPQIELDILMNNVRKLYEGLIHLNKLNAEPVSAPVQKPVTAPDDLIATNEQPLPEIKEVSVAPVIEIKAEVPAEPKASVDEVIAKTDLAAERTKEFTKPAQKAAATATLFDDAPSLAARFAPSPTLYDKISSSSEDKSLATKHQKNPVTDLKKSIGINEKFAFINELFDGDLNAYNEAVDQLNNSSNHESAVSLLESGFAAKLGWSNDGESYLKLKNLVDRRFTV